MAYEDVITRTAFTLNSHSLAVRVASDSLAELFRSGSSFPPRVEKLLRRAIFATSRAVTSGPAVRLNKATLYSWLLVYARIVTHSGELNSSIACQIMQFLGSRSELVPRELFDDDDSISLTLRRTFLDRATARVANVSSVLLRDAIIWYLLPTEAVPSALKPKVKELRNRLRHSVFSSRDLDSAVVESITSMGWELI